MTTNDLYQAAVADMAARKGHYGVSRLALADGSEVICSVTRVAGRSIVAKHSRTTWGIVLPGQQYAKNISYAKVMELLK